MIKIYISGPMTGHINYEQRFEMAEFYLRKKGYAVYNPAWNKFDEKVWAHEEMLKIDLSILSHCDAIYMLDGWEKSKGAIMEHELAEKIGLEILYEVIGG